MKVVSTPQASRPREAKNEGIMLGRGSAGRRRGTAGGESRTAEMRNAKWEMGAHAASDHG